MLDSRPFGTLQVVGAAQGQVPLWGRSDAPPTPPSQLPALCLLQDAPAAPGSWKPRMRTCVLGLIPPQSFLLPFL